MTRVVAKGMTRVVLVQVNTTVRKAREGTRGKAKEKETQKAIAKRKGQIRTTTATAKARIGAKRKAKAKAKGRQRVKHTVKVRSRMNQEKMRSIWARVNQTRQKDRKVKTKMTSRVAAQRIEQIASLMSTTKARIKGIMKMMTLMVCRTSLMMCLLAWTEAMRIMGRQP